MNSRILAVTPGDPDGIGPEVVWKGIRAGARRWAGTPLLCVGARRPFEKLRARIIPADPANLKPPKEKRPHVWLLEAPVSAPGGAFAPGYQAGWSIETAARLAKEGSVFGMVTGPISKERLNRGGFHFAGHTDMLAELCAAGDVTMMLANEKLRVALVTTHVSLGDVPRKLNAANIRRAVNHTVASLRGWWKVRKPRVAVCALNPHAGENGLFGREEMELISPTIQSLRDEWGANADISGPHPADTLFAKHVLAKPKERYDAVVCMYHDQGLIPVKLLDFPRTINVTLGLPILRTSVDHGTAFDIAGKDLADPSSFRSAVDSAIRIGKNLARPGKKAV